MGNISDAFPPLRVRCTPFEEYIPSCVLDGQLERAGEIFGGGAIIAFDGVKHDGFAENALAAARKRNFDGLIWLDAKKLTVAVCKVHQEIGVGLCDVGQAHAGAVSFGNFQLSVGGEVGALPEFAADACPKLDVRSGRVGAGLRVDGCAGGIAPCPNF